MDSEQFEQLLSAVNGGFAALATAIEEIAKMNDAVYSTSNGAGDGLTLRGRSLEDLEPKVEELLGDADTRRVVIGSFTAPFKWDASQGNDVNAALGVEDGEIAEDSEAGLAYKAIVSGAGRGSRAASGGGGGGKPDLKGTLAKVDALPGWAKKIVIAAHDDGELECPACGGNEFRFFESDDDKPNGNPKFPDISCANKGCKTDSGYAWGGWKPKAGGNRGRGRAA